MKESCAKLYGILFTPRADNGDAHDNNANIAKILQLRQERVKLLGFENYAQWHLLSWASPLSARE